MHIIVESWKLKVAAADLGQCCKKDTLPKDWCENCVGFWFDADDCQNFWDFITSKTFEIIQ